MSAIVRAREEWARRLEEAQADFERLGELVNECLDSSLLGRDELLLLGCDVADRVARDHAQVSNDERLPSWLELARAGARGTEPDPGVLRKALNCVKNTPKRERSSYFDVVYSLLLILAGDSELSDEALIIDALLCGTCAPELLGLIGVTEEPEDEIRWQAARVIGYLRGSDLPPVDPL